MTASVTIQASTISTVSRYVRVSVPEVQAIALDSLRFQELSSEKIQSMMDTIDGWISPLSALGFDDSVQDLDDALTDMSAELMKRRTASFKSITFGDWTAAGESSKESTILWNWRPVGTLTMGRAADGTTSVSVSLSLGDVAVKKTSQDDRHPNAVKAEIRRWAAEQVARA